MRSARRLLIGWVLVSGFAMAAAGAEQPIAWWKFDAAATREAASPWSPEGKVGGALVFGGANYVTVPEIGTFDAVTIAMWVRPDGLDHPFTALLNCEGWGPSMAHFQFARDGRVEFSVKGNSPADTFSAAAPGKNAGQWNHIAVVYDSKARKVRYYLNGKPDAESEYESALPVRLGALRIGAWDKEARFFRGRMDETRVYGKALDGAAVARLAAGEELKDGLEACWRMDEKAGTKAADSSGKGRDGTLTPSAAGATSDSVGGISDEVRGKARFVPGVSGNAMFFDGAATVVREAAKAPKMNPDGFSIEAWVAMPAYPKSGCTIVGQEQNRKGYIFSMDAEGHFHLQFAMGREWKDAMSLKKAPLGKWVHLAAAYSPDSGINLYMNGENVGNLVLLGPVLFAEDADLVIGRSFVGLLDDLVIHRTELSEKEAMKHYEAGRSAPGPVLGP